MGENDIAFFLENHNEEAFMKNEGKAKLIRKTQRNMNLYLIYIIGCSNIE